MAEKKRVVYGSYKTPEEITSVIQQLKDEGYTKDQITVYSHTEQDRTYDKVDRNQDEIRDERTYDKTDRNVQDDNEEGSFDTVDKNSEERSEHGSYDVIDKDRETDRNDKADMRTNNDADDSWWDQIKDFFTPDTYDYDKESQNPNYRKENDILYPHREDLVNGNRVVVLDKPNEEMNRVNI